MNNEPITYNFILFSVLILTVIISAIFLVYPHFDVLISGIFADGQNGFPLNQNFILSVLRQMFNIEVALLCFIAVWMAVYTRRQTETARTPKQFWDLIILSFLAGPLFLVNVVLKSYWGRPRPAHIEEFGGQMEFIPPYFISDQCLSNCSFVSGEGSAISTAGMLIGLTLWSCFPRYRRVIILLVAGISSIGIMMRVIKGRHFMSDTLLSVMFCALIILLLYKLLGLKNVREKITWENICHDLKGAFGLKQSKTS